MRTLTWVSPEPIDIATGGGGGIRQTQLLARVAATVPVRVVALGPVCDPRITSLANDVVLVPPERGGRPPSARDRVRALAGRSIPEVDRIRPFRDLVPPGWLGDARGSVVLNHLGLQPLARSVRGPLVAHLFHCAATHLEDEARLASGGRRARWRWYASTARRLQDDLVGRADLTVAVSRGDGQRFARRRPDAPVVVVPNGVETAADPDPPTADTVLFPATLDYGPNVDGASHLVHDVWPAVTARCPDARLVIAGRSPVPAVRALAEVPGVEVRGDVADMGAELEAARVVVVPLRYGTGTRLKALDALAARRSLVGTPVGLADLGLVDGVHARIRQDPVELAAAIVDALGSDDGEMHDAGRRLVEEGHSWDRLAEQLLQALHDHGALG